MDPVVIKDISGRMDTQAQAIASVLTVVQAQVDRARTAWQGPAASRFESSWNSQHRPSLVAAHEQLTTMSALLTSEATAQDVTSDALYGPGGGSGALPTSGGPGGSGAGGGPGSDGGSKDDDPLAWVDKVGQGAALLGLPFAAAEINALGRFGSAAYKLTSGSLANAASRASAIEDMYKAGFTQSEVAAELTKLDDASKPAMDILTKNLTNMTKFAGEQGGLGASKLADIAGKGAGVLAVLGDGLTLWRPGATGTQGVLNRVAAGANIVGTAGSFAATLAPAVGLDAGLFAANASLDWVPVAGQVLAVGTAAYLAYEQIPFIHNAVNDAATGIKDGVEWLGNEQIKLETDVLHGAENVASGALHGAENVASGALHGAENVASGALHVGGSIVHSVTSWL